MPFKDAYGKIHVARNVWIKKAATVETLRHFDYHRFLPLLPVSYEEGHNIKSREEASASETVHCKSKLSQKENRLMWSPDAAESGQPQFESNKGDSPPEQGMG